MCNQFTFHHQFGIDIGRTEFEQKTDSILSACDSYGQRTHRSCLAQETSKHGVLGRHQTCSKERIEVLSNAIERHHPLRHTPSQLYPEGYKDGNWRNHRRKSI